MIIPLDKLLTYSENKYVFTRASMLAVDKIGNIPMYPDNEESWKVVPNILKLTLNGDIKFDYDMIEGDQRGEK